MNSSLTNFNRAVRRSYLGSQQKVTEETSFHRSTRAVELLSVWRAWHRDGESRGRVVAEWRGHGMVGPYSSDPPRQQVTSVQNANLKVEASTL